METLDIRPSCGASAMPAKAAHSVNDLGAFQMLLERWNGEHSAPIDGAVGSALDQKPGARQNEPCGDHLASKQVLELMSRRSREIADEIAALRAQLCGLESALIVAQRDERETAILVLQELQAQYALRWGDVFGSRTLLPDRSTTGEASMPPEQCLSPLTKDAAEESSGKRWCGKGRHPKWLKKMLAEGRQLSEFLAPAERCSPNSGE